MNSSNKQILINNNSFWNDIQVSFSTHYNFLRIDLSATDIGVRKNMSFKKDNDFCINKITELKEPCIIDINGDKTISQLVKDFKMMLGTDIEVSRKSGNVWNLISLTASWTLEGQNEAGRFISSQMLDGEWKLQGNSIIGRIVPDKPC